MICHEQDQITGNCVKTLDVESWIVFFFFFVLIKELFIGQLADQKLLRRNITHEFDFKTCQSIMAKDYKLSSYIYIIDLYNIYHLDFFINTQFHNTRHGIKITLNVRNSYFTCLTVDNSCLTHRLLMY